ncbi:two pore domain potassium channel family protein [Candidatus Saccharibacteria bacterium]|nr:two pore domain potassium channel family protein [Candidatus Saccharibacteria bacterium]
MAKKKKEQGKPRIGRILLFGFAIILVGTISSHILEDLSWVDSFYFSVITLTTVGYGDITPHTDAGKIFTSIYVLVGITMLAAIANYLLNSTLVLRLKQRQLERHEDTDS